jgi:hypothetical protein
VVLVSCFRWSSTFRLNLVGKYLTYGFVAIGLVMLWGYGGVLSLGQGVFFGLGGYCMAMFLKLEASDPVSTKIQSTPGIPDFMDWNQITAAADCGGSRSDYLPFALLAVIAVPTLLAFIVSFAMFKRRVGGVYFAIITQAVALILSVLIIGQQGYTGGVNGITDLKTMLGWDIRTDSRQIHDPVLRQCGAADRLHPAVPLDPAQQARARCCWPCATRRTACASRATTCRCSRSSCSAWPRRCRPYRRRDVRAAGGLHVAVFRRHRAVDRDGDLRRGGRAHVAGRRRVRHLAGELRQDLLLGELSRPVAVPDGRRCSSAW